MSWFPCPSPCSYITIYRHLQRNPDNQMYPLFEYFENWCQDENRHGDFLAACLKARPELLNTWEAKLWSKWVHGWTGGMERLRRIG